MPKHLMYHCAHKILVFILIFVFTSFYEQNSEMYEEKEELVSIIKQAAKERLQMERQLAIAKPGPVSTNNIHQL
jgi:hypothetical protein